MSFESSRCVPMTRSTDPAASPADVSCCSLRRDEARQHPDRERIRREPLAERLEVLRREHRRGHEHRHLHAVLDQP